MVNINRSILILEQGVTSGQMDPNTLLVNVGCARGLFLKNHSSLDAFVTVVLQGRGSMRSRATTEQIHTKGDCRWDENCEFKISEKSTHLTVSVQHRTRIGGSDLIGRCEVPLDQARRLGGQMWFPLKKRKDDDKYRGEIQLQFNFLYEKPSLSISNISLNKIEKDGMLDKMKKKIKIRKHKQAEETMSVASGISAISMKSSRSHRFIDKLNKTFGGLHKSSALQPDVLSHTYEETQSYDSSNLFAPPTDNFFRDRDERFRPTISGIDSHADESINLSIPLPTHSTPMQNNRIMPSSPTMSTAESFHRANSIRSVASSGFGGSSKLPKMREGEGAMSHQDLLALVDSLRLELRVKDSRLRDMEEYMDNLISRVMERNPELLAAPLGPQKSKRRFF